LNGEDAAKEGWFPVRNFLPVRCLNTQRLAFGSLAKNKSKKIHGVSGFSSADSVYPVFTFGWPGKLSFIHPRGGYFSATEFAGLILKVSDSL